MTIESQLEHRIAKDTASKLSAGFRVSEMFGRRDGVRAPFKGTFGAKMNESALSASNLPQALFLSLTHVSFREIQI